MKNQKLALLGVIFVVVTAIASPVFSQDLIFAEDFETGDTSRWSDVVGVPSEVFRFSSITVRDPHIFVAVPVLGCTDITDTGVAGIVPSFNEWVQASIDSDGDGDGLLDHSYAMQFKPFSPAVTDAVVRFVEADCTDPMATTTCVQTPDSDTALATYDGLPSGPCLEPVAGSMSGYSPPVGAPMTPCFTTAPGTFEVNLNGLVIPFATVQLGATPDADPETMFTHGLFMGFLTETDANDVFLPADIPLIGGAPLSSLLPGGAGCCAPGDDRDSWGGQSGWWFYKNFESELVPFTE